MGSNAANNGRATYSTLSLLDGLVDGGWLDGLNAAEGRVLLVYLRRAGADGVSWPGVESVARDARLSVRTAHRAIASLTRRGILFTVDSGGGIGRTARRRVCVPSAPKNQAKRRKQ